MHQGVSGHAQESGLPSWQPLKAWLLGWGGVGVPRLTLECLLGESLPAASCLGTCLLPLLPAMVESRAWAGTCHRGSAGKQEKHRWLRVTQAMPSASLFGSPQAGPHGPTPWAVTTLSGRGQLVSIIVRALYQPVNSLRPHSDPLVILRGAETFSYLRPSGFSLL